MKNPFNYLQFAKGDQFYDRKEILSDLRSRFLSGQTNVVIYGPRRYGKSSLVGELSEQLCDARQSACCYLIVDAGRLHVPDFFVLQRYCHFDIRDMAF